ncbi:MAG TPA: nuclear transport factor 2 family protein [Edaphobacter sp.]|nr:nuclear transport factor 2 family protein [Edaphobacter sp.]
MKLADLEAEDLSKEILACEKKVYETFIGPQPDVEALQKLLLPDYLYIQSSGVIWNKEENVASLKSGVVFSSIEIKTPQVRKLSPTSAVIVARVLIEAAAGEHNLSTETLTSTVWVKQDDKWLSQLHTSTTAAQ